MKRVSFFCILLLLTAGMIFPQSISGVFDSTVNYVNGADDNPPHMWGIEEFVNLRLRINTGDNTAFFASFNFIAASGTFALNAVSSGTAIYGENYVAAMELERLYFRINGEHVDTEAGLLRMNFGYGQVWGSSDFLNPRNPMAYNARPRGVLGANLTWYPEDTLRMMGFIAAPRDPFEFDGRGFTPGFLLEKHWDTMSMQGIYALETPGSGTRLGLHRFGLSVKADFEMSFIVDALYTLNPDDAQGLDGLSFGAGFDYSFLDGDLIVMTEYLYNGSASVTARGFGGNFVNNHFLFSSAVYRFNDFFTGTLSAILCLDDLSFQPIIRLDYELFQGFMLNASLQIPMALGNSNGELGPTGTGSRAIINAGARLRF